MGLARANEWRERPAPGLGLSSPRMAASRRQASAQVCRSSAPSPTIAVLPTLLQRAQTILVAPTVIVRKNRGHVKVSRLSIVGAVFPLVRGGFCLASTTRRQGPHAPAPSSRPSIRIRPEPISKLLRPLFCVWTYRGARQDAVCFSANDVAVQPDLSCRAAESRETVVALSIPRGG